MNCPIVDARGKRKVNRIGFKWFALRAIKSVERLRNPLRKEERRQRVLHRRQINPIYLQQTELYILYGCKHATYHVIQNLPRVIWITGFIYVCHGILVS